MWLSESTKEIPTEATGRTCLILQDVLSGSAAIHTGRKADSELSEGKEPDL